MTGAYAMGWKMVDEIAKSKRSGFITILTDGRAGTRMKPRSTSPISEKLDSETNALSTFLNESGTSDATDAGIVLRRVGGHVRFIHKSQLHLISALSRLHEDISTFTRVAFEDVFLSVENLETARTSYRGSLMWMKHATKELDPDNPKTMKKLRKVQTQVKNSKLKFERLKMETMQKIDMLMASKNQLLSKGAFHYQQCLLNSLKAVQRKSKIILSYLQNTYPHCMVIKIKSDGADNTTLKHKTQEDRISVMNEYNDGTLCGQGTTRTNFKNMEKSSKGEDIYTCQVNRPSMSPIEDGGLLIDFSDISQNYPSNTDSFSDMYEVSLSVMDISLGAQNKLSLDSEQLAHSLPFPMAEVHPSSAKAYPSEDNLFKANSKTAYNYLPSQLLDDFRTDDNIACRNTLSVNSSPGDDKDDVQNEENWLKFLNTWDPLRLEEEVLNEKC